MNVYITFDGNGYGLPMFYQNDDHLKLALQQLMKKLKEDDPELLKELCERQLYSIGYYDPKKGKFSRHKKNFVFKIIDIVKEVLE